MPVLSDFDQLVRVYADGLVAQHNTNVSVSVRCMQQANRIAQRLGPEAALKALRAARLLATEEAGE